jgi:hypothetical protein
MPARRVLLALAFVGLGSARVDAESRIALMANDEPELHAALQVVLGGRDFAIVDLPPPDGPLSLDRAAEVQRSALRVRAGAGIWIEYDAGDAEVWVVSVSGRYIRHAPLPAGSGPRVFAAIATSLLDELLAPPEAVTVLDDHVEDRHPDPVTAASASPPDDLVRIVDDPLPAPTRHDADRTIRIDLGLSMSSRELRFTSRAYDQAPRGMSTTQAPGLRLEAAVYPFASRTEDHVLAGFGFAGAYDKTLTLAMMTAMQPETRFPVDQGHWSVGARYRFQARRLTVALGLDFGRRMFEIDRSQLRPGNVVDVPDCDYALLAPGVELHVPILASAAIVLGGSWMLVADTGPFASTQEYGGAKVMAGEARAGVDIAVGDHLAVRLFAEIAELGFTFAGNGMMTNARDGDPTTLDVAAARDRYVGGAATLAVLY